MCLPKLFRWPREEDLLAAVLRAGLQALWRPERDVYVGVEQYERSEERRPKRNRLRPRQ